MCKTVLLVVLCALAAGCGAPYTQLPMTQTQGMAQAEDALQRGQYANAVTGFSDYLATGQKTFRARAFFELAQAQYGLGNYSAALDTLADMEDQFPNERWPQTAALRGDIDYALGKRPDAIRQWDIACERGTDADRQYLHARAQNRPHIVALHLVGQLGRLWLRRDGTCQGGAFLALATGAGATAASAACQRTAARQRTAA